MPNQMTYMHCSIHMVFARLSPLNSHKNKNARLYLRVRYLCKFPSSYLTHIHLRKHRASIASSFRRQRTFVTLLTTVYFLFLFRSFRSITIIAEPGGVIGPLPRPNKGGRTTRKKQPIGQNYKTTVENALSYSTLVATMPLRDLKAMVVSGPIPGSRKVLQFFNCL